MYAAAARAVKRVSPQLQFGGPCPAFALDEGPYREGFLDFVKRNKLPLDFFTWMWFTDDSRDPLDFQTVATQLRGILDANGFETTELLLDYWNMTGIPNAKFTDGRRGLPGGRSRLSMTSSASASNVGGTSMPKALAVLRLITNSNFVGRSTGKLAGFSPLRMRPA